MEELRKLLQELVNDQLLQMIFSGRKSAGAAQQAEKTAGDGGTAAPNWSKIKVRPLMVRGTLAYQAAFWDGKKEVHRNYQRDELIREAVRWLERGFKQLQADTTTAGVSVLVSKKGKVTVRRRELDGKRPAARLAHNRKKCYILEEGVPVPFLVELGVMTREGKVVSSRYDKFRQINRFLEFIEDIVPHLPRGRELTMIDFGCGKSYLTFAMYYYLRELKGLDLRIIGLDLKEDVIAHCNALAEKFGYEKMQFLTGDIADYEGVEQVDLVVTLHACDTATDFALAKAVKWNAKAILSVPCCQHELNKQIRNDTLQPVLKYGLIKERMAALVTDGLRASLLEEQGYEVQVLEFIDMEHTPKNILIRAVRRGYGAKGQHPEIVPGARRGDGEFPETVPEARRDVKEHREDGEYPETAPEARRDVKEHREDGKYPETAPGEKGQCRAAGRAEDEKDGRLEACMQALSVDPTLYELLKNR